MFRVLLCSSLGACDYDVDYYIGRFFLGLLYVGGKVQLGWSSVRAAGPQIGHLLTPWLRVLLEKLTDLQLVKKFTTFYGTRRFIAALTNVRHLSLSWASPIQSIYPHPTSCRSILILSTHLRLGLPSGLLSSGFPTKTLYSPLLTHTHHMPSQSHSSRFLLRNCPPVFS